MDKEKDQAAQDLANKRWAKTTSKKKRTELGKKAAEARWAGHVAKRPAASRKPAKKKAVR